VSHRQDKSYRTDQRRPVGLDIVPDRPLNRVPAGDYRALRGLDRYTRTLGSEVVASDPYSLRPATPRSPREI